MSISKYGNRRTEVDGEVFDSRAESMRYIELRDMHRRGEIQSLVLQEAFKLVVNGVQVAVYRADFSYIQNGIKIVSDVKGMKTPLYRLKKKLMKACLGIDILEVNA